jgi:hypothetical protein
VTLPAGVTVSGDFTTKTYDARAYNAGSAALKYYDTGGSPIGLDGLGHPTAPWNLLVLAFGASVTPVTVDEFTARPEGAGVLAQWHATSEFENLGFNVYRRDFGGTWAKVNAALIPGRITQADAKTYRLYDWAAAEGGVW